MKLNIKIIIGSTRPNRFSEKPAQWMYDVAKKRDELDVELLDLRDFPLPFYDEPIPPSIIEGKYSNEVAMKWVKKIADADGYIIIAPEYNHSFPAVLKNALDYPYREWNNKPVGFVSYGSVAGARSVEQLRLVAVELQMAPIRLGVHIPGAIMFPIAMGKNEWNPDVFDPGLKNAPDKMLDQLLWWTKALKAAREQKV